MQRVNFILAAKSGEYLIVKQFEKHVIDKALQKGVHRLPEFIRKRFGEINFADTIEDFIHENEDVVLKVTSST